MSGTVKLASYHIAGCCHLANLVAWSQHIACTESVITTAWGRVSTVLTFFVSKSQYILRILSKCSLISYVTLDFLCSARQNIRQTWLVTPSFTWQGALIFFYKNAFVVINLLDSLIAVRPPIVRPVVTSYISKTKHDRPVFAMEQHTAFVWSIITSLCLLLFYCSLFLLNININEKLRAYIGISLFACILAKCLNKKNK